MSENENILINPDDLKKGRRKVIVDTYDPDNVKVNDNSGEITHEKEVENVAGKVTINYESEGRFGNPATLHFNEYNVENINDIGLSSHEKLFETTIAILTENNSERFDVSELTMEEIIETLIGIYMYSLGSTIHVHPWVDDCQSKLPPEEQKVNETEIDLRSLKYTSIDEADKKIQEYIKSQYEKMSKEEWVSFCKTKYEKHPTIDPEKHTIDDEVKTIKIKEPIEIVDRNSGDRYAFILTRAKHIIAAQKLIEKKYATLYKGIKNKKYPGVDSLVEEKALREAEIKKIQEKQAKDLILYSKAYSLVAKNGKQLSLDEALETYKKIPFTVMDDYMFYSNIIEFGVNDERDFTCPLCGEVKTRRLQQDILFIEFLPFTSNTKRELRKSPQVNICFGS